YLPQSQPLDQIDFENLSSVLQAFGDFIAYYNCGTCTGASVEHRHIQVIPSSTPPPLSTFICNSDGPTLLGFHYVWTRLTSLTPINLYKNYQDLLHQISSFPLFPQHNCLITKSWMMLVPRSKASAFGISINAMGYTGCVLVDTQEKLTWLKDHGVLKLLQEVGVAIPATT
ncbi:bifunctional AP-4-A phosphorylase/ADP sulfurylase, partial [Coelomomyces lativittatus]